MDDTNNKDVIDLVIARLKAIPSDASLSVGLSPNKTFNMDELIYQVRSGTEVGKQVIESQLFFLRSLQDLPVSDYVDSNH